MRFSSLGNLARPGELARFLRTVRHLRPRQIAFGIRYRAFPAPKAESYALLPRALRWACAGLGPWERTLVSSPEAGEAFTFLNETRPFGGDWIQAGAGRLWQYHLHYMDWIHESPMGREDWMRRWIMDNPANAGGAGWEPYPLSRRISSWCRHFAEAGLAPPPDILASLGAQAGRLYAEIEFHLDANHLLENLLALAFAGLYADLGHAPTLARRARVSAELRRALKSQFLADGGHYELSPMYHAALMHRGLDLLNAWSEGDPVAADGNTRGALAAACGPMAAWLEAMSVGGSYALFNDAAYGMAPDPAPLSEYAERLLGARPSPLGPLTALAASGYYRASAGKWTAIFDAGALGPDHQLGHAHCDMLSFCLWHDNRPLIVHPGTFAYTPGELRDYCRSTASHNTVSLDGQEQAELWGAHRVGRRGYPAGAAARELPGGALEMDGAHGGYSHLPGRPIPHRRLEVSPDRVAWRDTVDSERSHRRQAFLHFAPGTRLDPYDQGWRITLEGGPVFHLRSNRLWQEVQGWHCPRFGVKIKAPGLVCDFDSDPCECDITVAR